MERQWIEKIDNDKCLLLLSVLQIWRLTASFQILHHSQTQRKKSCTEQGKNKFPVEDKRWMVTFKAAGHPAILYIIKLPQERPFSSSVRSLCCHVAFGRISHPLCSEDHSMKFSENEWGQCVNREHNVEVMHSKSWAGVRLKRQQRHDEFRQESCKASWLLCCVSTASWSEAFFHSSVSHYIAVNCSWIIYLCLWLIFFSTIHAEMWGWQPIKSHWINII